MRIHQFLGLVSVIFCIIALAVPWMAIKAAFITVEISPLQLIGFLASPPKSSIDLSKSVTDPSSAMATMLMSLSQALLAMILSSFMTITAAICGTISIKEKKMAIPAAALCVISFAVFIVGVGSAQTITLFGLQFGVAPLPGVFAVLVSAALFMAMLVEFDWPFKGMKVSEGMKVEKIKESSEGKVYCVKCGSRNPSSAKYCYKCGEEIYKEG